MSKLNNIENTYGGSVKFVSTNVSGDKLLSLHGLTQNSVIITSLTNEDNEDKGIFSILATDYEGNPARITYTIQEGNGLYLDNDALSMHIDNKTLQVNDNGLHVNLDNVIDNNTIQNNKNKISVSTKNLPLTSEETNGVFAIDENTIKITGDTIYVETDNLDLASSTNIGIVKLDGKTIKLDKDNNIYIDTENLDHSNKSYYGISKPDNTTISVNNGIYSVNTESLKQATIKSFGISKPDNKTILSYNGIYSVNTQNIDKASELQYGVIKTDNESFIINDDNNIAVNDYDNITYNITYTGELIELVKEDVNLTYNLLLNYSFENNSPVISKFKCETITSTILSMPTPKTTLEKMPAENVTVDFIINTNCPFYVSVEIENNIMPGVLLYYIDYDKVERNTGNTGLTKIYQSTNGEDKTLSFSFIARNYASKNWQEYSQYTRAKISVNYINNINVGKTVYYDIIRFNSMYNIKDAEDIIDHYNRLLTPATIGTTGEVNIYNKAQGETGRQEITLDNENNNQIIGTTDYMHCEDENSHTHDYLEYSVSTCNHIPEDINYSKEEIIELINNGDPSMNYRIINTVYCDILLNSDIGTQNNHNEITNYGVLENSEDFYIKYIKSDENENIINKYIIYYIGNYIVTE